ncbi:hypothetical protein AB0I64_12245, partial [Nonomuraea sp. NPDC050405]
MTRRAVIGWVDGLPVGPERLERRLRELREGPLAAALPAPGGSEDRQLARWVTQFVLTEVLCEREAADRGLAPVDGRPLDRRAAVELGSVNASACDGNPWVRAVFEATPAEVPAAWRTPDRPAEPPLHRVRHRLFADEDGARSATAGDLEPLGAVALGSLPAAVSAALRSLPYGTLAGPVRDALGWHVAQAWPEPPQRLPQQSDPRAAEAA